MKSAIPVYAVAGGVSSFARARPDRTFAGLVLEAYQRMLADLGLPFARAREVIEGSVASYFSDHFADQAMAGIMAQEAMGLCPAPGHRVEAGGATGGVCLQEAWKAIASGSMDTCLAFGFEIMSSVNAWKGNEFIALASDTRFDYPLGGFYTAYYAMMAARHMKEFGTTPEDFSLAAVKNRRNACFNPFAQNPGDYSLEEIRASAPVAWPLSFLDICVMSDGAALVLLASEEGLRKIDRAAGRLPPRVRLSGIGRGSDFMRLADREQGEVPLLPHESPGEYAGEKFLGGRLSYPGAHSFRAGRLAAREAYQQAGVENPLADLDFVELHDAFSSSELQTYEDLGLCRYGESGAFIRSGAPFLKSVEYRIEENGEARAGLYLHMKRKGEIPVNPSGGLLACAHPIGATGLMQAVFALWQLQGVTGARFGNDALQIPDAKRGAVHSHAGTGTYVTVTILEREN